MHEFKVFTDYFRVVSKALFILLSVFGLISNTYAQSSDYGNWMTYAMTGKITDKWSTWVDVQYRNYNFIGDLEQIVFRPAIQYKLTDRISVAQGYTYVYSEPYVKGEKVSVEENRIYQQLQIRDQSGRFYFNHRYRIEERFVEDVFRLRFRYFLGLNIPLNKKTIEPSSYYFSAYDEIFLHSDKPLFDKNRVYCGIGYVFSQSVKLEIGDMAQMRESGTRHQLQIMVAQTINW